MQLGLAFSTIYLSNGMLLPSDPYFVRKKKNWQEKADFAVTGNAI